MSTKLYGRPLDENGAIEFRRQASPDAILLERALAILHRLATEHTGWRRFFYRWYYSDEPLRNDAANLVREAGFGMGMPLGTQLLGDRPAPAPTGDDRS